MIETYGWADHRIFAAPDAADGRTLLFGTDHASLFALDAATQTVVDRWRNRETIVVHEAPTEDREVLEALRDAQVLVPSAWLRLSIRPPFRSAPSFSRPRRRATCAAPTAMPAAGRTGGRRARCPPSSPAGPRAISSNRQAIANRSPLCCSAASRCSISRR
jgi:hypothetical protein